MKIQDGIGEKAGLFFSYTSIAAFSLICAFYYGWELASITLVILPILTIAAGILTKFQTSLTEKENFPKGKKYFNAISIRAILILC